MHYYPIGVLIVSWVFWLWDTYLEWRQYKVYKTTEKVPKEIADKMDHETFLKAKVYNVDKAKFGFISGFYSLVQSSIILCCFLMPYFWDLSSHIMTSKFGMTKSHTIEYEIFQSLLFTLITSVFGAVLGLPFSIYDTFVIEQRHGFNKQTAGFYTKDKLKKFLFTFTISCPIVAATIYIVRSGGPYFALYLWMFLFVVICIFTFFSGEILALFDKFVPLPEGKLRDRIEELAKTVNFPLKNIFVVENSKRSSHSNAYQTGIFNRKRIVIYDTLIEGYYDGKKDSEKPEDQDSSKKDEKKGCTHDEIIAILCHELGHWYHSHLWKNLGFIEVNFFLMFALFSYFYQDETFYRAFGYGDEMPVIVGLNLLNLILTPYFEFTGFIQTLMSRYFEYQSDAYACKKGYGEHLKTGLVKINVDNLGFPKHDELYSKFNHSHPTLLQRIKAIEKSD